MGTSAAPPRSLPQLHVGSVPHRRSSQLIPRGLSHTLQLSQHRPNTAPYRGAHPSGTAPQGSLTVQLPGSARRAAAPARAAAPSGRTHRRTAGSPVAALGDLLRAVPVGCGGTARSSVGFSRAAGSRCRVPGAPPAPTSVPAGPFSPISHSPLQLLLHSGSSLPSICSRTAHPASLTAQLWQRWVSLVQLELALLSHGQRWALQPSCYYQTLLTM